MRDSVSFTGISLGLDLVTEIKEVLHLLSMVWRRASTTLLGTLCLSINFVPEVLKAWSLDQQCQHPWELVRNADSQAPPYPLNQKLLG